VFNPKTTTLYKELVPLLKEINTLDKHSDEWDASWDEVELTWFEHSIDDNGNDIPELWEIGMSDFIALVQKDIA